MHCSILSGHYVTSCSCSFCVVINYILCGVNKSYIGCMPKSRTFSYVACKSWSLHQSREPVLKLTR